MPPRVDAPWNEGALAGLRQWATHNAAVRALLLTNSRAGAPDGSDALSDFDIIFAVRDIHPYFEDRAWIGDFGPVLVTYWDPIYSDPVTGLEVFGNVVQYESGLRIDFTLWPLEQLRQVVANDMLPADLDLGYAVLVDKDGLTTGLRAPGRTAFAPQRPDAAEFARIRRGVLQRRAVRGEVSAACRTAAGQVGARPRHEAGVPAPAARVAGRAANRLDSPDRIAREGAEAIDEP